MSSSNIVYDVIAMAGMTVVSFALFKYFILPSLTGLGGNSSSKNDSVVKGSSKHKRINELIRKNVLSDPNVSQKDAKLFETFDFFTHYLNSHERVIAQCLVFPEELSVTFADIGGLEEVKKSLYQSLCFPFQHPEIFNNSKKKNSRSLRQVPKGVLLYGPPGTGKTLLAKAIAKSCNCTFLNLQLELLGDFLLGESEKLAGAIFSFAKKVQPCIIFIDEIDALLGNRNGPFTHDARKNQVAIMLGHWDGFYSNREEENAPRVIVIGATNNISGIDPAALRRLPLKYHIPLPDAENRRQIFANLLSHEDYDSTVDISVLANMTQGLSGSDIKELIKKALSYPVAELIEQSFELEQQGISTVPSSNGEQSVLPDPRPLSMSDFIQAKQYVIRIPDASSHFKGFHESHDDPGVD